MNKKIKKRFSRFFPLEHEKNKTNFLIKASLVTFTTIFIINSIVAFYAIYKITDNTRQSLNTIRFSRGAVIEIQDQFMSWKDILISRNKYSDFRKNYYIFSQHAQRAENLLFNLKLECFEDKKILSKVSKLKNKHSAITETFTKHIVNLSEYNFKNIQNKIEVTRGKDKELIDNINEVARDIEYEVNKNTEFISNLFIAITASSFLIFICLILLYGREIARRLIHTHRILEEEVSERTIELRQINLNLNGEITEHKKTEQKLILSSNETLEKNAQLIISENKYKSLIEGTNDIIFTLDKNLQFTHANNSMSKILKINPEKINKYNLTDLLVSTGNEDLNSTEILKNRIQKSMKNGTTLNFSTEFKSDNLIEPLNLDVSLEFLELQEHFEILGKASKNTEDRHVNSFVCEKTEYSIENRLFAAEDISHKITDNLKRYLSVSEINMMRVSIREMIINAIEHGNLNISFDEKTAAMMEDNYFDLIRQKRNMPEYKDLRVKIEFMISPQKAIYKITDQGKGFNFKKVLAKFHESKENILLEHGRGIIMARSIFDELSYNKKGNQVLLVKYLNNAD